MNGRTRTAFVILGLACSTALVPVYSQTPAGTSAQAASGTVSKSDAYYNYAMGHLYAEEAAKYGGRAEYVNKAIDYYKKAMALDPSATVIGEELAEFYMRAGNAEKAVDLANNLIKENPNNASAHKILARMYASQLDPDQGKVDQTALRNAIEHYQKAADIDPKDAESLSSLAHLYRVAKDDAKAEKAYKAVIALDTADDDALTGLAELYAGRGDFGAAIALLEPVSGEDANPETLQILAELYEESRDFSKAADVWKRLLPIANGIQVRKHYCEDLRQTNRIDEAIAAWTDLAAAEPKSVEDLIELADLWSTKRNFAKAHEVLDKAKTIEPANVGVRMAGAELLDAEGKTPDGIATVEEILKETKKTVYSDAQRLERIGMLRSLASMQKNGDKVQDAVVSYRQIADLDPSTAPVWEAEVIETLAQAKDFKGARAAADAALKKFTGDKGIQLEHASLLATLGEYDKAINEIRSLPDVDKDARLLMNVAEVQEKAKRYKDALTTLDAATMVADSQQKLLIVYMRGAMYEHEKEYDEAEQQFRTVLKANPDHAGALNYLGYMLADRNVRLDEAQQLISKAVDLEPDNGAYLDSLGWVHYRQNRLDQAADELRQALDSREDRNIRNDPTVHDHLAEVYFKQGKFKEAAQEWELSVSEMKTASPSEMDPAELKRLTQRLDEAKAKVNAKAQK